MKFINCRENSPKKLCLIIFFFPLHLDLEGKCNNVKESCEEAFIETKEKKPRKSHERIQLHFHQTAADVTDMVQLWEDCNVKKKDC